MLRRCAFKRNAGKMKQTVARVRLLATLQALLKRPFLPLLLHLQGSLIAVQLSMMLQENTIFSSRTFTLIDAAPAGCGAMDCRTKCRRAKKAKAEKQRPKPGRAKRAHNDKHAACRQELAGDECDEVDIDGPGSPIGWAGNGDAGTDDGEGKALADALPPNGKEAPVLSDGTVCMAMSEMLLLEAIRDGGEATRGCACMAMQTIREGRPRAAANQQ